MTTPNGGPGDPYARVEYRRIIAWKKRIERESPFLLRLLDESPERSVIDLGCGTGEHVAFFARSGARAVGIDRSESMIEAARDHESQGEGTFFEGEVAAPPAELVELAPFGLAICLGNVLPHLLEDEELDGFLRSAHDLLAPGGRFLIQIVNYTRLRTQGVRTLPVNVRPDSTAGRDDTEIVFLRVLRHLGDDRWQFFPTTLTLDPLREAPLETRSSRCVELRGWEHAALAGRLRSAGFDVGLHGDIHGGPFEPDSSHDLVVVATRPR